MIQYSTGGEGITEPLNVRAPKLQMQRASYEADPVNLLVPRWEAGTCIIYSRNYISRNGGNAAKREGKRT